VVSKLRSVRRAKMASSIVASSIRRTSPDWRLGTANTVRGSSRARILASSSSDACCDGRQDAGSVQAIELYGIRRNALGCASKGKYLGIRVIDSRHNEDFKNIGSVILAAKSHQAFDDLLNGDAGRWPIDSLEGFRGRPV